MFLGFKCFVLGYENVLVWFDGWTLNNLWDYVYYELEMEISSGKGSSDLRPIELLPADMNHKYSPTLLNIITMNTTNLYSILVVGLFGLTQII